jgi:hypothetical protein
MRRKWVLIGLCTLIMIVLIYAWIDGGREPVRMIWTPVPTPEHAA